MEIRRLLMSGRPGRLAATLALAASLITSMGCGGCGEPDPDPGMDTGPGMDVGGDDMGGGDMAPGDMGADMGGDAGMMGGGLAIEGLDAEVTVRIDSLGVMHIECETDNDCYAAQGYFHAKQRFLQMDLARRRVRGRLATLVGVAGLESDVPMRALMSDAQGNPLEDIYYETASESAKSGLQAYARGVNAWLGDLRAGQNDASLTLEYDLFIINSNPDNIPDWEPQDTVALYLEMSRRLSERSSTELTAGQVFEALDAAVATDLWTLKPGIPSYVIPSANEPVSVRDGRIDAPAQQIDLEQVAELKRRLDGKGDLLADARRRLEAIAPDPLHFASLGSNNWVVGPQRTSDGQTLLANDPHLSLDNPPIWHFVELDSKTNGSGNLHVVGASIPSVPGVVVGHNEQIGYGVTTAYFDLSDAYIEDVSSDGSTVSFDSDEDGTPEDVPIVEKEHTFEVFGGNPETRTLRFVPHHGPIVSEDTDDNSAISIRWSAAEPGPDLDTFFDLMVAEDVSEAFTALEQLTAINQNFVVIDASGSIGWYPYAKIPSRPWASPLLAPWLPLPGEGNAEWDGFLPDSDIPQLVDPNGAFIATANADIDGATADGDPTNDGRPYLQGSMATGHRHARIVELITEANDPHTIDSMHEIQADTFSLHGELLVPHLLTEADAASGLSSGAQDLVSALRSWNYTCPTGLDGIDPVEASAVEDAVESAESIGCSAFHAVIPRLTALAFADELAPSGLEAAVYWERLQPALIYLLDDPTELSGGDAYWDDITTMDTTETRQEIVVAALEQAATDLTTILGANSDEWRWGRIHTLTVESLLSAISSQWNLGPYANDGGLFTVDVADPSGRVDSETDEMQYGHGHGASLRVVVEARDGTLSGTFQVPGGQDLHRDSMWFNNLIEEYLANTPLDMLFEQSAVEADTEEVFTLQPAN